ncbi:hypothetical protein Vadar_015985 [Vaccinium darrowii]|uniref:Uncharacterized protein n=1 Tax=Vaccinium darrowii TaxID=229202 RepID=A0ACB7ZC21_9ERIC|nr:hypothetical protein Vadar_015985 [Vaccinium darrowii]
MAVASTGEEEVNQIAAELNKTLKMGRDSGSVIYASYLIVWSATTASRSSKLLCPSKALQEGEHKAIPQLQNQVPLGVQEVTYPLLLLLRGQLWRCFGAGLGLRVLRSAVQPNKDAGSGAADFGRPLSGGSDFGFFSGEVYQSNSIYVVFRSNHGAAVGLLWGVSGVGRQSVLTAKDVLHFYNAWKAASTGEEEVNQIAAELNKTLKMGRDYQLRGLDYPVLFPCLPINELSVGVMAAQWRVMIFEKNPTKIKNYGIWLRYQSRTGYHNMYQEYHNMYQEYRDTTLNDPIFMVLLMASWHRVRHHCIQIIKTATVPAKLCKRESTKQFHNSKIKFPLVSKKVKPPSRKLKTTYKASRPNLFV